MTVNHSSISSYHDNNLNSDRTVSIFTPKPQIRHRYSGKGISQGSRTIKNDVLIVYANDLVFTRKRNYPKQIKLKIGDKFIRNATSET